MRRHGEKAGVRRPRHPDTPTRRTRSRRGFTLMELLMVVVIILVATALAIPRFVRSYKGAKLRTSMRTLVMTSRYARGVSVLQQKQTALLFDTSKNSVEMVTVSSSLSADQRSQFLDQRDGAGQADAGHVESELVRLLSDGVRMLEVDVGAEDREVDGIYWVNFYANGMCDKFVVRLEDEDHKRAHLAVDPLSGTAKVTYEN